MKNILVFFCVLLLFAACDLAKLEPAQTKSFIKYFGDEGKTYGEDLLKLDDGYLLLGNNYAGEDFASHNYSVLVKTDLNGNTVWTQIHENIEGRAMVKVNDGYYIVGDGINGANTTMMLIKTNLQGSQVRAIEPLGNPGDSYHGTALTISSANEVIVSGYIESGTESDQFFVYGYPADLSASTWDDISKLPRENVITSRRLIEVASGEAGNPFFVSTLLENTGSGESLQAFGLQKDALTPGPSPDLLKDFVIDGEIGDIVATSPTDGAIVQTVLNNGNKEIAFARITTGIGDYAPVIISPDNSGGAFDYIAHSLVKTSDNNYVILGSTDNTGGNVARTDTDFFIKKIASDGTDISNGFTLTFGGEGLEYGSRIIQADDGGYVFIGSNENTNEVDFMVLVKITKDGKLIN